LYLQTGTTGFEITPNNDIDKQCGQWKVKLDQSREKKMKSQEIYGKNQLQVMIHQHELSRQKSLLKQCKSLNWKLYAKFAKANSKYQDIQQAQVYFLHKLVLEHKLESVVDSDVTVPMEPSSDEDDGNSLGGSDDGAASIDF
jgi:hypothetical protein